MAESRAAHPPGLYVLFFTELWERYSFYSMASILVLYMDEHLHFSVGRSGQIYGLYLGGVYFMPLVGGLLADRAIGFNRAVVIGGVLMMCGHLALGIESLAFFYAGLVLLACGSGLLKPNVSTIVGNLYRDRPELRDAAFNIFYMGINIGAFVSPLAVSWFRARFGWSVAFASAAGAMAVSLAVFVGFNRHVRDAARKVEAGSAEDRAVAAGEARRRVVTLLLVFAISVIFWLAFFQNGFTLTLWARDNMRTSRPPEQFYAIEPLAVIALSLPLVALWNRLRARGREPSTPAKMLVGILLTALAFGLMAAAAFAGGDAGRVSPWWLVWAYIIIAIGEISLSPMGLSLVTRVAPPRSRGILMGGWFVATAAGGYLSGAIGRYWDLLPHSRFFLFLVGILAATGGALLAMIPVMTRTIDRVAAEERQTAP